MVSEASDYAAWVGRTEDRSDWIDASPLDRLAASLDRDDPPVKAGDAVPPLAHWLFFLPRERQSGLGEDGHPTRGGFLPPVNDLPRRMWAGGRLTFGEPLKVGAAARRLSTIVSVTPRAGKTGPLVFVTVRHEISLAITEEHDIVYRGLQNGPSAEPPKAPPPAAWQRTIVPDSVLLFRYSALTFNGHRIHYDRSYVTEVEHYPGLVVHGPLLATLLVDWLRRNIGSATITDFSFRAVSPCFDGMPVHLNAVPPDANGCVDLWAAGADGRLFMRAEAHVR